MKRKTETNGKNSLPEIEKVTEPDQLFTRIEGQGDNAFSPCDGHRMGGGLQSSGVS